MSLIKVTAAFLDDLETELETPIPFTFNADTLLEPIRERDGVAHIFLSKRGSKDSYYEILTVESYDVVTAQTLAYADATINSSRRTILQGAGSITDGVAAGTYGLVSTGGAAVVNGGNFATPPVAIYIDSADFPVVNGLSPKLALRAECNANNVAPGVNFTIGLYPITRPTSSGGAGVLVYDYGTVVSGSTNLFTTPAADFQGRSNVSPFDLPANGWYAIGVVNSGTVAANSHVHFNVHLQIINA